MRVLLIDNYDSFTWNLVHDLAALGAGVDVVLNDRITAERVVEDGYDAVVISPGPGRPEHAGVSLDVVRTAAGRVPLFGVCLGHQAIAQAFGAEIVAAPTLVHGKTTPVLHDGRSVFEGLPTPFEAARYHSLMIDPASVPAEIEVSARSPDGVVMGLRHVSFCVEGVQFHPESILTIHGRTMIGNFLRRAAALSNRTESCIF